MEQYISVIDAAYKGDYRVEVSFSDSVKKVVDFGNFLRTNDHPQYNSYKNPEQFKSFRVERGNLVWGNNWDLIFPVLDLYEGTI